MEGLEVIGCCTAGGLAETAVAIDAGAPELGVNEALAIHPVLRPRRALTCASADMHVEANCGASFEIDVGVQGGLRSLKSSLAQSGGLYARVRQMEHL